MSRSYTSSPPCASISVLWDYFTFYHLDQSSLKKSHVCSLFCRVQSSGYDTMVPYSLVGGYQHLEGTYGLHLQGQHLTIFLPILFFHLY
jgi:hypothetical protein